MAGVGAWTFGGKSVGQVRDGITLTIAGATLAISTRRKIGGGHVTQWAKKRGPLQVGFKAYLDGVSVSDILGLIGTVGTLAGPDGESYSSMLLAPNDATTWALFINAPGVRGVPLFFQEQAS